MIESKVSISLAAFQVPDVAKEGRAYVAMPPAPVAPCVTDSYQDKEWLEPAIAPRQFLLSEIPPETLLKICQDFTEEVFKRAGKSDFLLAKAGA